MNEAATSVEVIRVQSGREATQAVDRLAVEEPIEIRLDGTPLAVLMRTPGQEADLILGFAITEGIVLSPNEVASVEDLGDGDRYRLVLAEGVKVDPEQLRQNVAAWTAMLAIAADAPGEFGPVPATSSGG